MEIKLYYRFFSVTFQDSFATRRIHAACPIIRNLIQIVNKFKLKNIVTFDTLLKKDQLQYFSYKFSVEDTNRITRTKTFQDSE